MVGLNQIQKAALPNDKLLALIAEFDYIGRSLDQLIFNTFSQLDLMSPAATDLLDKVEASRKKRRETTAEVEDFTVPPEEAAPPGSLAGACRCRKAPFFKFRCPCVRARQKCTASCYCDADCQGIF